MSEDRGSVRVEQGAKRVRAYLGASWWPTPDDPCSCSKTPTIRLLLASGRRGGGPDGHRRAVPLTEPRRRGPSRRGGRRAAGPGGGAPLRRLAHRGAARCRADRVGRHGRVLEEDEPSTPIPEPVLARGHPGEQPPCRCRARRAHARRFAPAEDPLRDRAATSLLPAAHRPVGGAPAAVVHGDPLPYKGRQPTGRSSWGTLHETWSGSTGRRCLRVRRSPGLPASTARRSTSPSTVSVSSAREPSSAERRCPRAPRGRNRPWPSHNCSPSCPCPTSSGTHVVHEALRPAAGQPPMTTLVEWKVWNLDGCRSSATEPSRVRTAQSRRSDLAVHIAELEGRELSPGRWWRRTRG